jgi:hypothetical protein
LVLAYDELDDDCGMGGMGYSRPYNGLCNIHKIWLIRDDGVLDADSGVDITSSRSRLDHERQQPVRHL